MYQDLHFYIDLDWTKHIETPNDYLKKVFSLVDFAYQHKAKVYFSHAQLQDFTANCGDLEENFSVSFGSLLDLILQNSVSLKEQNHVFEVCYANENTSLRHISHPVISSLQIHAKQVMLSHSLSNINLLSVKSNVEFENIKFLYLNDIQSIREWIMENVSTRLFNPSPKHGTKDIPKFSSNKGQKVSQLLCSVDEADELLKYAIADFREIENRLFNWDNEHNSFIEFFYEGNNQWHGFHLDEIDWKRVPDSIRKFFSK